MDNVFQYILQLQTYQPMLTILTVLAAFLVGLYVFFIYRITFAGVIYSRTFNLSLVMLCMVTATVISMPSRWTVLDLIRPWGSWATICLICLLALSS